jgi:glycosyltransferase involved in cell wall biosynthesis
MKRPPFWRLLSGPTPERDRIFFTNLWFRGHNNPRYAELLPRLGRLDGYLIVLPDRRVLRGASWRALHATRGLRYSLLLGAAGRRYRALFTTDNEQIEYFAGPIVSDVDDPKYSEREVELLKLPQVAAYVVTAESAARRFESLGVGTPWYVVPQGVSLASLSEAARLDVATRYRREDDFVVGYMAAFLRSRGDLGGENPLYNVDHLLELWPPIAEQIPEARLWLLGEPSGRIRSRVAGRHDVLLLGRVPKANILAYVANFDVALYPRTHDQGIRAAKVAEYLGAGVPVVSYDYAVTQDVKDAGAGILVSSASEFVEAVVSLARDPAQRRALAAAARDEGKKRDWDVLAADYRRILDERLPPA